MRPTISSAPTTHTPKRIVGHDTRVLLEAVALEAPLWSGIFTNALEAESWELEAETELETGNWKLETELEAGSWKLAADSIVTRSSCQRGSAIDSAGSARYQSADWLPL